MNATVDSGASGFVGGASRANFGLYQFARTRCASPGYDFYVKAPLYEGYRAICMFIDLRSYVPLALIQMSLYEKAVSKK